MSQFKEEIIPAIKTYYAQLIGFIGAGILTIPFILLSVWIAKYVWLAIVWIWN